MVASMLHAIQEIRQRSRKRSGRLGPVVDRPEEKETETNTGWCFSNHVFVRRFGITAAGLIASTILLLPLLLVPSTKRFFWRWNSGDNRPQMIKHDDDDSGSAARRGIPLSLNLVTMNIARVEPSAVAPSEFNLENQLQVLIEELLRTDPDVLCLQECPDARCMEEKFPAYSRIQSRPSHAGFTTILVKLSLELKPIAGPNLPYDTPAAIATLVHRADDSDHKEDRPVLAIASVHLKPFERGSFGRLQQIEDLVSASTDLGVPLIFAGDTNMRDTEDSSAEERFQLKDAWKEAGQEEITQYTWDTIDHRPSGGTFNQYYGSSTRQYQRRYDRIYVHGTNLSVKSFNLLANQPIGESRDHFLSDHFGIAAHLEVNA